jgi:phosphatidate cytidylyltransferase
VRNGIVNDHIFVLNTLYISVFEIVFYFLILMMFALFSTVFTVHDAFYLFSMGVYIGITYICMLFLRYLPNSSMFYAEEGLKSSLLADFTVVGAVMNDVGAYFVGVLLGKHKMAPRVSPNKTWEGFFGGIIFSVSFSLTFAWLTDYYGYPILPGILSWSNYWWRILIMSLVMPIAGDFGDLMFSLIKRAFAIKDYGTLLPGHGGVLDRIDGLSVIVIVNVIFILGFLYGSEVLLWL